MSWRSSKQIIAILLLCCEVCVSGIAHSSLRSWTTSVKRRKFHSLKYVLLGFTTINHFEQEENDAESNIWLDVESDEDREEIEYESDEQDELDAIEPKENNEVPPCWNKEKVQSIAKSDNDAQIKQIEEHPMRTDEWLIKVHLSPFCILPRDVKREGALFGSMQRKKNNQIMKFTKNGYVFLTEGEKRDKSKDDRKNCERIISVGKWRMDANGISWTLTAHSPRADSIQGSYQAPSPTMDEDAIIPTNKNEEKGPMKMIRLYYHADIHLSKFQSKPRMFKGTITRDRMCETDPVENKGFWGRKLFRPVIASFTAEGIGEDTLILNYKDRGFGLGNNGH